MKFFPAPVMLPFWSSHDRIILPSASPIRRRHRSAEEAVALIADWRSSGLGKSAFCHERGIPQSQLWSCLGRATSNNMNSPAPAGFVEVLPRLSTSRGLTLEIADGVRVVGLDVSAVAALITALRAVSR